MIRSIEYPPTSLAYRRDTVTDWVGTLIAGQDTYTVENR